MVVTMLIIPLPPALLDFFITLNISGGLMIVVASMYLNSALEFSAFPSLLLLTTMFRLAINISVDAGRSSRPETPARWSRRSASSWSTATSSSAS